MSICGSTLRRARTALRWLRTRRYRYKRLVEVRISRAALLHNYETFARTCAPAAIAPVLKSNAYSHGLVETARILEEAQPPFLVVESYHEALILRNEGIRTPILIVGYTATENIVRCRMPRVAFGLVDFGQLVELAATLRRPRRFHLKVDTGMRRYGIGLDQLDDAVRVLRQARCLVLEGACSHMAKTATLDTSVADNQVAAWNRVTRVVREAFPDAPYLHLAGTGGSYWSSRTDASVIRLGLGLYGYDYSPHRALPLKPALSVVSTIGSVRHMASGEAIGYGHTFIAPRALTVATVVSGYYAGVNIGLTNCGCVQVRRTTCPIVGKVCMNGTMVDVSHVSGIRVGDRVTIISDNPEDDNSIGRIAKLVGTSRHVILIGIPAQLRRVVV